MFCTHCGTQIPDGAQFCPKCGATQAQAQGAPSRPQSTPPQPQGMQVQPQDTPPRPQSTPPQGPSPKKRWPLVVGICAAALVLVVVGIAVFTFVLRGANGNTDQGRKDAGQQFDIVFTVSIQGYDTGSSRIPVSIEGTDVNGNEVSEVVYLAYEGVDTQLPAGSYQVSAIGSPIAKDGTIYTYTNSPYSFKVDKSVAGYENNNGRPTIAVQSVQSLSYSPVSPNKMTDKAINEALDWARKDTESKADVATLEKAAKARKNKGSTNALWSSPRFFTDSASRACTLQRFGNMAVLQR